MPKRRKRDQWRDQKTEWHLTGRFRSRFGIKLTERLRYDILEQIMFGDALLCENHYSDREVYLITVEDQLVKVIYNRNFQRLVTALPLLY